MKKIILVVDDQPDIRRLISMTLNYGNYELHEASNGTEALRFAQALRPDLILLDVMMPGAVDGFQVCTEVKQQAKPPVVIMLTARGQVTDLHEGREAGCDEYLIKPFSPLQLIELVERYLGS